MVKMKKNKIKRKMMKLLAGIFMTCFLIMETPTGLKETGNLGEVHAAEITLQNPRMEQQNGRKNVIWDCVWFGSYPQSEIIQTDGAIYTTLQNAPEEAWIENDITIDGIHYRRMNGYDAEIASTAYSKRYYQWKNGKDEYHYFRYEPIKWRVLEVEDNVAFLLSDGTLDCSQYGKAQDGLVWENATIRSWLNGYGAQSNREGRDFSKDNFIDRAFSQKEKEAILTTEVVNNDSPGFGTEGGRNTQDKIYLLSEEELLNTSYGFSTDVWDFNEARVATKAFMSDYSILRGSSFSTAIMNRPAEREQHAAQWWTRSPGTESFRVCVVYEYGMVRTDGIPQIIGISVRPVIRLDLTNTNVYAYAGTVSSQGDVEEVTAPDLWSPKEVTIEQLPRPSILTYGDSLGTASLTGGVVTVDGSVLEGKWYFSDTNIVPQVSDSQNTLYEISFYPKDWKTYKKGIATTPVLVTKAMCPPNYPVVKEELEEKPAVIYETYQNGKTVGEVSLDEYPGWQWSEESRDILLEKNDIHTPITATVEYVGEDKGNYDLLTAEIYIVVNDCEHEWENNVVSEPTCMSYGTMSYSCNKCSVSYMVADLSKPRKKCFYEFNQVESTYPNCTEDGLYVYTCCWCKKSYTEVQKHKNHQYESQSVSPTCMTDGYAKYNCVTCGSSVEYELEATGHAYFETASVPATCIAEGSVTKTCRYCDDEISEKVGAKGHAYEIDRTEPTCTADGKEIKTCTRQGCGHRLSKVLHATGHKIAGSWMETRETCTKAGLKVEYCDICKEFLKTVVHAKGHDYKTTFIPASLKEDGQIVKQCKNNCGPIQRTYISKIQSVKLSAISYSYNGKTKTPTVTIKDSTGKKLKKNTDYTVTYAKGRKNVGEYKVTIKFKGNYTGKVTKTFTIKPKATSLSKVKAQKKGFKVTWKKQSSQVSGYEIQYSTSSKFTKKTTKNVKVKSYKSTSKSISKLKAKKKYYVRIRTYKTVKMNGKSETLYSGWSKAKTVTTKKK